MSRSGGRNVCLIFALMLLPIFTTPAGLNRMALSLKHRRLSHSPAGEESRSKPGQHCGQGRRSGAGAIFVDPKSGFPDAPYRSTDREINAAGVVVGAREGIIVTSTHVIEQANDIRSPFRTKDDSRGPASMPIRTRTLR